MWIAAQTLDKAIRHCLRDLCAAHNHGYALTDNGRKINTLLKRQALAVGRDHHAVLDGRAGDRPRHARRGRAACTAAISAASRALASTSATLARRLSPPVCS